MGPPQAEGPPYHEWVVTTVEHLRLVAQAESHASLDADLVTGRINVAGLLPDAMIAQSQANSPFVVAPTGFEPVFESRRAFASIVGDLGRVE